MTEFEILNAALEEIRGGNRSVVLTEEQREALDKDLPEETADKLFANATQLYRDEDDLLLYGNY